MVILPAHLLSHRLDFRQQILFVFPFSKGGDVFLEEFVLNSGYFERVIIVQRR